MNKYLLFLKAFLLAVVFVGCARTSEQFWDDAKSAGRYVNRGFSSLGGRHEDSRAVRHREEFESTEEVAYNQGALTRRGDFIALADVPEEKSRRFGEAPAAQPKESPGDATSSIPGIQAFKNPTNDPQLKGIFKNVPFPYNSSLVKGQNHLETLRQVASYLKKHPNTYIFIEGHCDERGAEAYNLALGARRSNAARNLLISDGVNPDHVFTISYGKERPLIQGHDEDAWAVNRRAEFKVYQR